MHFYSDIRNAEDVNMQANMQMGGLVYDTTSPAPTSPPTGR